MRKIVLLFFGLLSFILVLLYGRSAFADALPRPDTDKFTQKQRLIVRFRPYIPEYFRQRSIRRYGLAISDDLLLERAVIIEVPQSQADRIAKNLSRSYVVEFAEPDMVATEVGVPNDPYYPNQWGLEKIDTPGAWDTIQGSDAVEIAILDTGIEDNHPDLQGKITAGANCTRSGCPGWNPYDYRGHGTHVAGIAAAATNNGVGIAGSGYDTRLMAVKVLDDWGRGYYSWVANGIVWAADNGAEVINISLGGSSDSATLEEAVDYAWSKGVVVVAAAGNSNTDRSFYPAYYANSIAVAATDENDNRASFSNYGSWVDIAAPGASILSTYPTSSYAYGNGTSMATPFVSGVAALISANYPTYDNQQIRSKLENSADKITGTGVYWQHGRLNACGAVDCAVVLPTDTPSPSPTPNATNTPSPTPLPSPIPSPTPTATPLPSPTVTPMPLPPTSTPTPMPTATPTPLPSPTPTAPPPSPTPTPQPQEPLPWWCVYIPWHYTCR